jgi:hypothetical protein
MLPIVLAFKVDECERCGFVGTHALLRKTHWFTLFWVPVLPIWVSHGLACPICGLYSKVGYREVRQALQTNNLSLNRPRPTLTAQLVEEGATSSYVAQVADNVVPNADRGLVDKYLKFWAVGAAILLVVVLVLPRTNNVPGAVPTNDPNAVTAHTCWVTADTLNGCRDDDGSRMLFGTATGEQTTCYFREPLPPGGSATCR